MRPLLITLLHFPLSRGDNYVSKTSGRSAEIALVKRLFLAVLE
jgi:hypothetical protein